MWRLISPDPSKDICPASLNTETKMCSSMRMSELSSIKLECLISGGCRGFDPSSSIYHGYRYVSQVRWNQTWTLCHEKQCREMIDKGHWLNNKTNTHPVRYWDSSSFFTQGLLIVVGCGWRVVEWFMSQSWKLAKIKSSEVRILLFRRDVAHLVNSFESGGWVQILSSRL